MSQVAFSSYYILSFIWHSDPFVCCFVQGYLNLFNYIGVKGMQFKEMPLSDRMEQLSSWLIFHPHIVAYQCELDQ